MGTESGDAVAVGDFTYKKAGHPSQAPGWSYVPTAAGRGLHHGIQAAIGVVNLGADTVDRLHDLRCLLGQRHLGGVGFGNVELVGGESVGIGADHAFHAPPDTGHGTQDGDCGGDDFPGDGHALSLRTTVSTKYPPNTM